MLPILQSSGVIGVRPPDAEDVVENSDSIKDFQLPDLFAALVGEAEDESANSERPEESPEEMIILEAPDELTAKVPNPNHSETSVVEKAAREQQGQRETVKSEDIPGDLRASAGPSKHVPISAVLAVAEPRLSSDGPEGLTETVRTGTNNPKAPIVISDSQSGFRQPTEFHAVPGLPSEPSARMQGEAIQSSPILLRGEKPDRQPMSERLFVSAQSQPAPLLTPLTNTASPQTHLLEPRLETDRRRTPEARTPEARAAERTAINSASTLEFEAPPTANRPLTERQALVPTLTNGPVTMGQTANPMLENDDGLRAGLATTTEHHLQTNSLEATLRSTPAQPTEIPRNIARQLAEISQRMPDRPVEVALNPEELGRVRMSISTHDTGITMALLAERPETLDLMRRHIDQLTQEFHALGFGDVRFSFSQNNESDGGSAEAMKQCSSAQADVSTEQATIQLSMGPSTGLDIRL